MRFLNVKLHHFRNIASLEFEPARRVNIIRGDNAQGKTNLIEALWLLSGARSFRGAKDAELVSFNEESCTLLCSFFNEGREQTVDMNLLPKRKTLLNGIPCTAAADLSLPLVVFSPVHLSLVKDGPAQRRRFLDDAVGKLYPSYEGNLNYYNKALFQRGCLLRDAAGHAQLLDMLDVWDDHLARAGAQIIRLRYRYIDRACSLARRAYNGISGGREELTLGYRCSIDGVDAQTDITALRALFLHELQKSRAQDLRLARTGCGAHLDDLEIRINDLNARQYGSQGQQRSCVLALKLAECGILKECTDSDPVVLLDDVMSELDARRRDFLLESVEDRQVFLTCCDENEMDVGPQDRVFIMDGGVLHPDR